MTTDIKTERWETIVKEIKFENRWNTTLEKHLKDNNLTEIPEPEWSDDPTMDYIYLPAKSRNGEGVMMYKTKERMFPEMNVG